MSQAQMLACHIRPVMMWVNQKTLERRINVVDMTMKRLACGHTSLDKIKNNEIRNRIKVTEIHRNIHKKRPRWYGNILRHEEDLMT
jgi:hypothetical protein